MTGIYGALGVLAALRHRESTGVGQHIDLAQLDVHVSALTYFATNYLASGVVPQRMGNANPVTFPSGTFASADGQLMLIVGNDAQIGRFCRALGCPELARDDRFLTSPLRVRHRDLLTAAIGPALARQPSEYWMREMEAIGVPCAPINDLRGVFTDPQVQERAMVGRVEHSALGEIPFIRNPLRMSAGPCDSGHAPPTLGEHTDETLRTVVGLSPEQIATLRALGVV